MVPITKLPTSKQSILHLNYRPSGVSLAAIGLSSVLCVTHFGRLLVGSAKTPMLELILWFLVSLSGILLFVFVVWLRLQDSRYIILTESQLIAPVRALAIDHHAFERRDIVSVTRSEVARSIFLFYKFTASHVLTIEFKTGKVTVMAAHLPSNEAFESLCSALGASNGQHKKVV